MDGVADIAEAPAGMPDGELYEYDFPAWCERQGVLLRQVAESAAGGIQPDWPRVIEEIEDMGAAERRRVEGLLIQAFAHLLKLRADPNGRDANHWTVEISAFLLAARRAYAPSMRQRLDLDDLWQDALYPLEQRRVSSPCPFALTDLIVSAPNVAALIAKLL